MAFLPALDDPGQLAARIRKAQAAKAAKPATDSHGQLVGQILDATQTLQPGSLSDEITRAALRRAGLDVRSQDEILLQGLETQNRLRKARQDDALGQIEEVRAALSRLSPDILKQSGIDPDTILDTDPDKFLLAAHQLKMPLTRETLTLAGLPITSTENAQLAESAKASKAKGEKAADVTHGETIAKGEQAAAAGEGPIGQAVLGVTAGVPARSFDESEPSHRLFQQYSASIGAQATQGDKELLAYGVLAKNKDAFADQVEEGVRDEKGRLILGVPGKTLGVETVTGPAIGNLGLLLADINKYLPGSKADGEDFPGATALRAIGLGSKFSGINPESLAAFTQYAQEQAAAAEKAAGKSP